MGMFEVDNVYQFNFSLGINININYTYLLCILTVYICGCQY